MTTWITDSGSVTFDATPLADQSVLTFGDEKAGFQITVAQDAISGAFSAWLEMQHKQLARALPGYSLVKKTEDMVAGRKAIHLEHKARSPSGQPMRQRQCYVDGGGRVIIVTLSHLDKDNSAADAAFQQLLRTLEVRP